MPLSFKLEKYPNKYFIETGTYLGDGVKKALTSNAFQYIYSVEIDTLRHITAREAFSIYENVTIIKGDSGELLKLILKHIDFPCTFWLDAHYNGDEAEYGPKWCPLVEELEAIKNHPVKTHTIIVDDYRCMDNTHFDHERKIPVGFPGKKNLLKILLSINPDYSIKFLDGVEPNDIVVARVDYEDIVENCLDKIITKIEYNDELDRTTENLVNKIIKESKYEIENEGRIISEIILKEIIDEVDIIVNENYEESLRRKELELIKWEERLEEREINGEVIVQEVFLDIDELKKIEEKIHIQDEKLFEREKEIDEREKIIKEKEEQIAIKELTFKEMILDLHLQSQIKRYDNLERKANARDARKQKRKRHTKKK